MSRMRTRWWCPRCGAELTLDSRSLLPLRLFRPPNACERFPHRWERVWDHVSNDSEPPPTLPGDRR